MNAIEQDARTFDEPAVVVGVDGTRTALDAVRWAAAEARVRGLPLRIVHAAPYVRGQDGPAARRARDILARAFTVARRTEPGLSVATHCSGQPPADSLLAASENARLLVVGMGGGERPQEVLIGSVALDVCGCAPCPVTVVRGHLDRTGWRPVLVGVDRPVDDAAVLDVAFADARLHGDRLVVLHARHGTGTAYERAAGHDQAAHMATWDRLADELAPWAMRFPDVAVELEIRHGQPTPTLLAAAVQARMVVLGSRGRSAPARALFGSTSRQVLRRSTVPVTIVSSRAARPEDAEPGTTPDRESVATGADLDPHDRSQLW
ncbi:universal stress protein [Pseudonocardia yunnanensis]|uniref:Universal stress protein n=1 Tax=Pseudonocardia yunnanensis TaxID=58107 RepID=A0ABW4EPL2_9PSEU